MWQTRSLEVRPDRLPPEYEAQVHHPHLFGNMPRGPPPPHPFPYGLPFPPPGQPLYSSMPPRPGSFSGGPGPQQMLGVMSMPGMTHLSPHPQTMGPTGTSPVLSTSSPLGPNGVPIHVRQQSGSFGSTGSTPFAGSLTASSQPFGFNPARRASSTGIPHTLSPNVTGTSLPRSTSPIPGHLSRPVSRNSRSSPVTMDAETLPHLRAGAPGNLGALPPKLFAGIKPVLSPEDELPFGPNLDMPSSGSNRAPGPVLSIALEGLAKGMPLGAPGTLRDRVVFASNVSFNDFDLTGADENSSHSPCSGKT
jgi:hypothetical protein